MVRLDPRFFPRSEAHHLVLGTVLSDIAKSRADIEGARLLVLSAALQIDKRQAKGALKEIGIAKVCRSSLGGRDYPEWLNANSLVRCAFDGSSSCRPCYSGVWSGRFVTGSILS